MELLFSNYPPMKTDWSTFSDVFYSLIPQSTKMDIAVGYVSTDSLMEMEKILEMNSNIHQLNLIIGMHYYELFTKVQYGAAMKLNEFLKNNDRGEVKLVHAFRYHGKLYSYSNDKGPFAGIVGSNNLSSIVDGGVRVYESSVLFCQPDETKKIHDFICKLMQTSANIAELEIDSFNTEKSPLEGHESVEKVSPQKLADVISSKTDIAFEIPIKPYEDAPKSNLNAYFGKGRQSKNGLIKPRHWYECELIVPQSIRSKKDYPKKDVVFTVITDDGWSFKCKHSGDNGKNFRSESDLNILGKWMKGRMENEDVLKAGAPVDKDVLNRYGRQSFTLNKTEDPEVWFLDFNPKEK